MPRSTESLSDYAKLAVSFIAVIHVRCLFFYLPVSSNPRYLCNQVKHQKQRLMLDIISSIRYR
ncbi:hypothetical protein [Treponema endosymbiont of Eucomonympha sp.]|uniref:hypothetical protein n=1 Tax=Treponema endosymbiont of Eucomonympha sp. TaxID=1580831 RepID=UPI000B15FD3F|nr:hypothetical protein [Treponema endosymbiont of Eucomonympha sp.]